jgi:uncharacterized protein (TIRG00374 family)
MGDNNQDIINGNENDVESIKEQLNEIVGEEIGSVSAIDNDGEEILNENIVKDKLVEIAVNSTTKKKRKSNLTSLLMLAVNVVLVYLLASSLFKSADDASISNLIMIQGSRLKYLSYGLLLFLIVMLCDSLLIAMILKLTTGKFRFFVSYKTSAIGKYYEAITPLSAGGQPSQILYLAKRKVSPGIATSVPLIRIMLINIATIILSTILFVFVVPQIEATNSFMSILYGLLKILAYVGLVVNLFFLITVIIIASSKTLGRNLARNLIKVGTKLKIVKNYREAYKKLLNQVTEYQNSINYLRKHLGMAILLVLVVSVEIIALASVPFVVSIGLTNIHFWSSNQFFEFYFECMAKYYICYMASSYIPLPGGTGMMEISFVILFSSVIGSNFVVWAFLIWRLLSYYILIVQGFGITIGDIVASSIRKDKKQNRATIKNRC